MYPVDSQNGTSYSQKIAGIVNRLYLKYCFLFKFRYDKFICAKYYLKDHGDFK